MSHKLFREYCQEQADLRLVVEWLVANGYDIDENNVNTIVEGKFLDTIRKYGKKATLPLALAALGGHGSADAAQHKPAHPQNRPAAQAPAQPGRQDAARQQAARERAAQRQELARQQAARERAAQQHQQRQGQRHDAEVQRRQAEIERQREIEAERRRQVGIERHRTVDAERHAEIERHRRVDAERQVAFDQRQINQMTTYINRAFVSQQYYVNAAVTNVQPEESSTVLVLTLTSTHGWEAYQSRPARQRLLEIIKQSLESQGFHVQSVKVIAKDDVSATLAVSGAYEAAESGRELFSVKVRISNDQ